MCVLARYYWQDVLFCRYRSELMSTYLVRQYSLIARFTYGSSILVCKGILAGFPHSVCGGWISILFSKAQLVKAWCSGQAGFPHSVCGGVKDAYYFSLLFCWQYSCSCVLGDRQKESESNILEQQFLLHRAMQAMKSSCTRCNLLSTFYLLMQSTECNYGQLRP